MSGEPKPSSTVVVVREQASALEVLLLQRSSRREGRAGPWVFPGGKIEPADCEDGSSDPAPGARRAAVREAHEEAGIGLDASALVPISRWITPEVAPKRFDTWFFLIATDTASDVRVDGEEICRHRWLDPGAALELHHQGEIELAPPTFVTVTWLAEVRGMDGALALGDSPLLTFRPRICPVPGGFCMLYPGDAGYEDAEPQRAGSRHRLWRSESGRYRYERSASGV